MYLAMLLDRQFQGPGIYLFLSLCLFVYVCLCLFVVILTN